MYTVIEYLGAVLRDLLPSLYYYNGIPLNQHLLYNSTMAISMIEPNAIYLVSISIPWSPLKAPCKLLACGCNYR